MHAWWATQYTYATLRYGAVAHVESHLYVYLFSLFLLDLHNTYRIIWNLGLRQHTYLNGVDD